MRNSLSIVIHLYLFFLIITVDFLLAQSNISVEYLATWGEKGSDPLQFKDPQGIAVDPGGFIYIADTGNHRIQKLDQSGWFISEIGGFGWEKEQFDHPVSVCARNGLDVFIADYYNHRIERYDKDLHYISSFKSEETLSSYLQFGFPVGIEFSRQGELFCVDGENHRVLKLDILGNPQISFGDYNAGEGTLKDPRKIFISTDEHVYISDTENASVCVFDIHGNYLLSLGTDFLKRPMGLTEIGRRYMAVTDAEKNLVFIIQKTGGLVVSFGGWKGNPEMFEEPVDIACWRNRIFILDKSRCTIDLFQIGQ